MMGVLSGGYGAGHALTGVNVAIGRLENERELKSWIENELTNDIEALARQPVQVAVIATASLPAAGEDQDGRLVIEDAGAGDRNLIVYAGGQRFRIDGGAAF
jgi:PIN domain nuclease of toxin-antitoxin system